MEREAQWVLLVVKMLAVIDQTRLWQSELKLKLAFSLWFIIGYCFGPKDVSGSLSLVCASTVLGFAKTSTTMFLVAVAIFNSQLG